MTWTAIILPQIVLVSNLDINDWWGPVEWLETALCTKLLDFLYSVAITASVRGKFCLQDSTGQSLEGWPYCLILLSTHVSPLSSRTLHQRRNYAGAQRSDACMWGVYVLWCKSPLLLTEKIITLCTSSIPLCCEASFLGRWGPRWILGVCWVSCGLVLTIRYLSPSEVCLSKHQLQRDYRLPLSHD